MSGYNRVLAIADFIYVNVLCSKGQFHQHKLVMFSVFWVGESKVSLNSEKYFHLRTQQTSLSTQAQRSTAQFWPKWLFQHPSKTSEAKGSAGFNSSCSNPFPSPILSFIIRSSEFEWNCLQVLIFISYWQYYFYQAHISRSFILLWLSWTRGNYLVPSLGFERKPFRN